MEFKEGFCWKTWDQAGKNAQKEMGLRYPSPESREGKSATEISDEFLTIQYVEYLKLVRSEEDV